MDIVDKLVERRRIVQIVAGAGYLRRGHRFGDIVHMGAGINAFAIDGCVISLRFRTVDRTLNSGQTTAVADWENRPARRR